MAESVDNVAVSIELNEHITNDHTIDKTELQSQINAQETEQQTAWNNLTPIESYFEKHKLLFTTTTNPSYFESNKDKFWIKFTLVSCFGIISKAIDIILFIDAIVFVFCIWFNSSSGDSNKCLNLLSDNQNYDILYILRFIFTFGFGVVLATGYILLILYSLFRCTISLLTCYKIKDSDMEFSGGGSAASLILVVLLFVTKILVIAFRAVSVLQMFLITRELKKREYSEKQTSTEDSYIKIPPLLKLHWVEILSLGETLFSGQLLWGLSLWELIELTPVLRRKDFVLRIFKIIFGIPSVILAYKALYILLIKQWNRIKDLQDEVEDAHAIVKKGLNSGQIHPFLWIFVIPMLPTMIFGCYFCDYMCWG